MLITCLSQLLEFVFPSHCTACNAYLTLNDRHFCALCSVTLNCLELACTCCGRALLGYGPIQCQSCHDTPPAFDHLWWATEYGGATQQAIVRCKYQQKSHLAKRLAQLWCKSPIVGRDWDYIVPVPLHRARLRTRGYNQSALLAAQIGKMIERPVVYNELTRIKNTTPQVELSGAGRRRNLIGAFGVKKRHSFMGASILLVDDVVTTGATMNACAKALKRAGAARVDGWSVAREG